MNVASHHRCGGRNLVYQPRHIRSRNGIREPVAQLGQHIILHHPLHLTDGSTLRLCREVSWQETPDRLRSRLRSLRGSVRRRRVTAGFDIAQNCASLFARFGQAEAGAISAQSDVARFAGDPFADDEALNPGSAHPNAQAGHNRVAEFQTTGGRRLHPLELRVCDCSRFHVTDFLSAGLEAVTLGNGWTRIPRYPAGSRGIVSHCN